MVCVDCDDMGGSSQERSPVAQCFDYSEEFQVVDVVVVLRFDKGRRIVANGVSFVVFSSL